MKKHIILIAVAVLSAFSMKAGDLNLNNTTYGGGSSDSKLTIGISVGAAIPLSDYAKHDTTHGYSVGGARGYDSTSRAGYAQTGFHFDVTAGYLIGGPVGAMVMIGGNMNSFDATDFESENNIKSPATFSSTSYYLGQYLVGPYLSLPAGDKLRVNIRALVGLMTCNTTTMTYNNGQSGALAANGTYSGNGGSGFGYDFGLGIKFNFNDKMGLLVNLDYAGSSIAYTGYVESTTDTFGSSTYTNTTLKSTMAVGLFTASIGIAFNL